MRNYISIALLLLASSVFAYDPPTMGWSSWNTYRVNISDKLIMKQADAMSRNGLKEVGCKYINIDDGYFGGRDASGELITHPVRFPNGLKQTVDHIHTLGFKAGIYSDAGRNTCGSFWDKDSLGINVGFYGHDRQDADYFFKEIGFDFIKIDFCGGDAKQNFDQLGLDEQERYTAIHNAILATSRKDVRMNVCRWDFPGTWVHDVAFSWRISQDINPSWESVKNIIRQNLYLSAYASEGKYNDMDMLEIGRGMSEEEDKTHFGMWCIMSSPLLIGCDLTTISEKSLRLLKNEELIALNQDVLGLQAYVVKQMDGVYILTDLEEVNGNTCAVAVYNSTDEERTIHLDFADFYLRGDVSVRDLFERRDLGKYKDRDFSVTIPAHGTRIFRLDGLERGERTVYEAECAWLQDYQEIKNHKAFGTAIYEDDGNCSGGAKVTGLGNRDSNYLEWYNVYSREGGLYLMSVDYQCAENRELICQVNGVFVKNVEAHPAHEVASEQIEIHLKPGMNRIRLSNGNSWMPDIDRMVLQKK